MSFGTVNVGSTPQDNSNYVSQEQVGVPGGIATLGGDGIHSIRKQYAYLHAFYVSLP